MRALKIITGHVIYNPAYNYKFQLKTALIAIELSGRRSKVQSSSTGISKNLLLNQILQKKPKFTEEFLISK